ncbi:hypothetical protein [Enterobacter bugandensis]|uniref:hypothetical protein n=2 Tax=Enterobacteriaceae TaxID=543 RepID=UPI0029D45537|nr:hypothetical protein [Enterobacter bugandensis]MDX7626786.1 hypothetical protein [Enterobacter bugandensis]
MDNTKRYALTIFTTFILGSIAINAMADLPAGRYDYTAPEPANTVSSSIAEYKKKKLNWHDENTISPEFTQKKSIFGGFNQEETYTTRKGKVSISGTSKFNPYTSEKEEESVSLGYDW